jgi:hypothetical protein
MTMTKKLIDWTTVPIGAAVVYSNFIDSTTVAWWIRQSAEAKEQTFGWTASIMHPTYSQVQVLNEDKTSCEIYHVSQLRLAPPDQQPWLVYEGGVTELPEWAECTYHGLNPVLFLGQPDINEEFSSINDAYVLKAYKLGNGEGKLFKTGWTDNPNEVTS